AVHADVADLRIRHRDQLPLVRRIGEDLLVAGHARVEDELARRLPRRPEGTAAKHGAVGERENRVAHDATRSGGPAGPSSWPSVPPPKVATAGPWSSQPSKGVLRLFERKPRADTFHRRSGSTIVRSAGAPTASVPASRPRSCAGPTAMRATSVGRSS